MEEANQFLRDEYIAEFNRRFWVRPTQPGSAFLPCGHRDLDLVFSIQQTRTVARDNTIQLGNHWLQIEPTGWRGSLAGCRVLVHEHLDGTRTIRYGPHVVGRYNAQGWPLLEQRKTRRRKAMEKPLRGKPKAGSPLRLEIPPHRRDFHFPTARRAAKDQL